jgi:regulation of enolase protein 1 (concanavalin A-like superfamily)
MEWHNEPPQWTDADGVLSVVSGPSTDFWRRTHDGGIRDNGHFYHRELTGDFRVEVEIEGEYRDLYDQAGLMLRLDEATWLKCGIELVNDVQQMSVVVTRDYSDWSVVSLPDPPASARIRVTRHQGTAEVHYALGDGPITLLRQAFLTDAPTLKAGPMCASPTGNGFGVRFRGLQLQG